MSMWIAGANSDTLWKALKPSLVANSNDKDLWETAYWSFYRTRIETRYLKPIASIQQHDRELGEGFAITALFCTLIEFLETCEQGHNFVYGAKNKKTATTHKYGLGVGGKYFLKFLTTRVPFDKHFSKQDADSFYTNVRCGLLHEARTQDGWTLSTEPSGGKLFVKKGTNKTLYRKELIPTLLQYFSDYERRLLSTKATQDAFIRKFDHLCN